MLIALDTSTALASLAFYNENGVQAEVTWQSHRDQTVQLLPLAQRMLELQNSSPDKFIGVAVALGPGSFNGLRVGLSSAKGLALALGIPLFGISSLEVIAHQHSFLSGSLCAMVEVGRGRLGVGFFKVKGGIYKQTGEFLNLALDELLEKVSGPTFFAGELSREQRQKLRDKLGKNSPLLSPAMGLRRAGLLAEIAWNRLEEGDLGDDLATLQPFYLHQPMALKS